MHNEKQLHRIRLVEKIVIALILTAVVAIFAGFAVSAQGVSGFVLLCLFFILVLGVLQLYLHTSVTKRLERIETQVHPDNSGQFQSLYEQNPTALVTTDASGTIVSFNPAAVELLETTMDDLQGANFFDQVHKGDGQDVSVLKSKIEAGLTLSEEELLLHTYADREIWVLLSAYQDGHSQNHVISLIDITQAKKIDNAKSEFVALATHQLRTPTAAIRWNFELLSKKLPEEVRGSLDKYVTKIDRNIFRMIALIDDFLSVSKLETGTFATKKEPFNLSEFMANILDEYTEKITEKGITVTREENPADFVFVSDTRLLHIIVSNLVSNSVKYLKDQGQLNVGYQVEGKELRIVVADNGIGIPHADLPQLFKRFFRASNARSHQTEGTGLGLYIAQEAAAKLGGVITVASKEDVETVFTVTLPV